MKKAFSKILLLGLVAALAIVLLLVANSAYSIKSIRRDPFGQLEKSLNKTKSILQQDILFATHESISQALKNGAMEFTFAGTDGTSAGGKLYLRDNALALTDASIVSGEESAAFSFWLNNKAMAVAIPSEKGTDAYGLDFQTLASDLQKSPLLTVAGISYEEIEPLLDALSASAKEEPKENADLLSLLNAKSQFDALLKKCAVTATETTLPTDTNEMPAFRVTISMTPAQICDAVDIYTAWFISTNAYKSLQADDPQEATDLQKSAEDLKQALNDSNASILIDFYLHTENELILRADLRFDQLINQKAATAYATIELGNDPATSLLYSIKLGREHPTEGKDSTHIEYHRTHAHNMPTRKLVIRHKEGNTTVFDLHKNELTNTFDLALMDNTYNIRGASTSKDGTHTLQLDLGNNNTLTIAFLTEATMPEMPKYRNLCFLTEDELETLLPELEEEDIPGWEDDPNDDGNYVELVVMGSDNIARYAQIYQDQYNSLGDFLVAEGIAELDEQGQIVKILASEYLGFFVDGETEIPGDHWDVFVNNEPFEGSLYDVSLDNDISVSMFDGEPEV